jgi:4-amino-4-deoxy-L-arabinose transferase-like glycosyltransferase
VKQENNRAWRLDLLAYALILAAGFSILTPRIGSYGFWDPWEPKYTESVREMKALGTWITPYYRGDIRFTKPILVYWGIRLSSLFFGLNEFGARFASNGVAILAAVLIYFALSKLRGRGVGLLAALIMLTSPQFFYLAKQATTDIYLTAFSGASAALLALAFFGTYRRDLVFVLAYACLSFAFLAKGPLALVLPALPVLIYLATSYDYANLFKAPLKGPTIRMLLLFTPVGVFLFALSCVSVLAAAPASWWYVELPAALAGIRSAVLRVTGVTGEPDDPRMPMFFLGLVALVIAGGVALFVHYFRKYVALPGNESFRAVSRQFFRQCLIFVIVFVVIAGPWHAAIFIKHGGLYIREFIGKHNINREVVEVSDRGGKSDYYFRAVIFGMFPWSALVPLALVLLVGTRTRELWREYGPEAFFLLWFATVFAFFSQATTKFYHYLAPAVPVLAMLVAFFLGRYLKGDNPTLFRISFFMGLLFSLVINRDMVDYKLEYMINSFTVKNAVPDNVANMVAYKWTFLLWALSFLALFLLKKSRVAVGFMVAAAFVFSIYASDYFLPRLAPHKTLKPHCEKYLQLKGEQIALYGKTKHSAIYYTDRKVIMLGENPARLLRFMADRKRSFCIIQRQSLYELRNVIRESGLTLYSVPVEHFDYALICNTPVFGETAPLPYQ